MSIIESIIAVAMSATWTAAALALVGLFAKLAWYPLVWGWGLV